MLHDPNSKPVLALEDAPRKTSAQMGGLVSISERNGKSISARFISNSLLLSLESAHPRLLPGLLLPPGAPALPLSPQHTAGSRLHHLPPEPEIILLFHPPPQFAGKPASTSIWAGLQRNMAQGGLYLACSPPAPVRAMARGCTGPGPFCHSKECTPSPASAPV